MAVPLHVRCVACSMLVLGSAGVCGAQPPPVYVKSCQALVRSGVVDSTRLVTVQNIAPCTVWYGKSLAAFASACLRVVKFVVLTLCFWQSTECMAMGNCES